MGTDDATADDSEVLRDREGKRMRLFIAAISVIIVVTVVGSSYSFVNRSNEPAEVVEEIEPWEYPFYDAEAQRVLEDANAQLTAMKLGNIRPIDPDSNEFRVHLFRNNNWGITYWKFHDEDTEILVNAETGEIFDCWSTARGDEVRRHLEVEETTEYVLALMSQFAPLPGDMDPPYFYHSAWSDEGVVLPNGSYGYVERFDNWDYNFNRSYDGICTSDSIEVWIDVDGSLTWYSKGWFMDLEGFDITYTVSSEEAESVAREFLSTAHGEPNETLIWCRKAIDYPEDLDSGPLPGNTPMCIWRFEFRGPGPWCNTHWVGVTGRGEPEILYFNHCR